MNNREKETNRNIGGNRRNEIVEELHAKLAWYTKEATVEEFDPKAVEAILYLLDIYEPLEAQTVNVDDAWACFEKKIVRQEASADVQEKADSNVKSKKLIIGVKRQKVIAAAVLSILLLALVGTTQAEAIKQSGFFFWLQQDEEGRQMVTVPEKLERLSEDICGERYYNWEMVPGECLESMPIGESWEEGKLIWKYIDVTWGDNYQFIKSFYEERQTENEVAVGVVSYAGKITINTEIFDDYKYVRCYEGESGTSIYRYEREDKKGNVFYSLCRMENNCVYFVEGSDLKLLEVLIEKF